MRYFICLFIFFILLLHVGYAQKSYHLSKGGIDEHINRSLKSTANFAPSHARRARLLNVNPSIQAHGVIDVNDTLLLELFNDVKFKAVVEKTSRDLNNTTMHRAKVIGFKYAYVLISTHNSKTLMTVDIPSNGDQYRLFYNKGLNKHVLFQVDKSKRDVIENVPPLVPPVDSMNINKQPIPLKSNTIDNKNAPAGDLVGDTGPTVISLMIVYTPAAASWASTNEGGIANTISAIMNKAQLVLDNSNVDITLDLVHTSEVNYTEEHTNNDLGNITNTNDGIMDEVHVWRDSCYADLVVLLEETNFTGGLGWTLGNIYGTPTHGFSLTRVQQASGSYTTIHEIGHNMGLHHHKDQNYQPGPTEWWNWSANTWSAGWRWTGTDNGKYCSVMTYERGQYFDDGIDHAKVPFFSDPDVWLQGALAGHASYADNVRTMTGTKASVADYRINPVPDNYQLTNSVLLNGEMECYNATQQITVAGDTYPVIVESVATSTFVAGNSIRFMPGFHAESGSYVDAHITTTGTFCDPVENSVVAAQPSSVYQTDELSSTTKNSPAQRFVVYPNPNNGRFTIKLENIEDETRVLMFNSVGQKVYDVTMIEQLHSVELPDVQRGFYFIKAINNKKQFDQKIVIQ